MAFHLSDGKNGKLPFYLRGALRLAVPEAWARTERHALLAEIEGRADREYIRSRVDYYNRLVPGSELSPQAPLLGDFRLRGNKSAYWFDAAPMIRRFDPALRWEYVFGDVNWVPEWPSIVKSRPVEGENANSILLKINSIRHFIFLADRTPFRQKKEQAVFRGHIRKKPGRIAFMERWHGHPAVDAGAIGPLDDHPAAWARKPISLWEHLESRYILALEGNDVASNLKWIMSSNSVAVMPRPKFETWFMEGTLVPEHHYIEIRPDYADLLEKMAWYDAHPAAAEAIVRNAHAYIAPFRERHREELIALAVLEKYFRMTGQI